MNPIEHVADEIGHGIKVAAVDAAHAVKIAVEWLPKAEKLIATAIKDQPDLKEAVLDLVKNAAGVIADVGIDVATKGINLAADAKTLADAESFFQYFSGSFIPLVEKLYAEIKTDAAA